jgi:hypothetical protein
MGGVFFCLRSSNFFKRKKEKKESALQGAG